MSNTFEELKKYENDGYKFTQRYSYSSNGALEIELEKNDKKIRLSFSDSKERFEVKIYYRIY